MTFIFEQSDTEIYASHAGLSVAGPIINRHSGLKKRLKSIPLRHGIAHIDLIRTYLGLLCQGKNDFEAVEGVRKDPFFQHALGIGRVPSLARLRQRFDEQAEALTAAVDDCLAPLLTNLRTEVTPLSTGHVALHADVFCLDRILPRARQLAGKRKLLVTLDGAHDAAANREQLSREQVDYLIKWNPRGESPDSWKERAETEGRFEETRPGKRVAMFNEVIEWTFEKQTHCGRRVVRLIERTEDRHGQPLLFPELSLEGWWTSLDASAIDAEALITLYQQRGTSEQYHSEFKTDLYLERLPSGKFETNALAAMVA